MLGSATSNQQPASGCVALTPSEFRFSKTLLTGVFALLALTPLSAENNGAFIQGGVNYYSNFSGTVTSVVKSASVQDLINAAEQNLIEELVKDGDTPARAKELAQIGLPAMAKAIESKYPNGIPSSTTTTHYNGNLYGGNIEVGYKQFFGKKKRVGLRYYGMFSGQAGNYYNANEQTSKQTGQDKSYNQPSANLFYGVGIDVLYNFYEKEDQTYGIFGGVMVGGSTWLMGEPLIDPTLKDKSCVYPPNQSRGCISMNDNYKNAAKQVNKDNISKALFSPTYVQFVFNFGFRINFTKHQGFEFGTRIPTIDDPYYKMTQTRTTQNSKTGKWSVKGSGTTITFRRNASLYWNYVYNF
ncbi:outer membrane protein [Helicobacter felis]|uniref:outer membrane protein n=1 Tax=Helicobacter felis TaxID=214 RepID=UPI001F222A2A|nr:outer membrane protein [Helicobacter felis]